MTILFIVFCASFLSVIVLLKTNLVNIVLDEPNHRSLHISPIPRTGGLAIMLGLLIGIFLLDGLRVWIGLIVALMMVSLLDDIFGLPVKFRLLAQVILCAYFVWFLLPQNTWLAGILVLLMLVWITNLYNFMDGSDGLAGGMALFGFGAYALASYMVGNVQVALMCGAIEIGRAHV